MSEKEAAIVSATASEATEGHGSSSQQGRSILSTESAAKGCLNISHGGAHLTSRPGAQSGTGISRWPGEYQQITARPAAQGGTGSPKWPSEYRQRTGRSPNSAGSQNIETFWASSGVVLAALVVPRVRREHRCRVFILSRDGDRVGH